MNTQVSRLALSSPGSGGAFIAIVAIGMVCRATMMTTALPQL